MEQEEKQEAKQAKPGQLLAMGLGLCVGLSLIAIYFVGWLAGIALGSLVLGTSLIFFGVAKER